MREIILLYPLWKVERGETSIGWVRVGRKATENMGMGQIN
jgi:hypothetical protein